MTKRHNLILEGYPSDIPINWSLYLNGVLLVTLGDKTYMESLRNNIKAALRNHGGVEEPFIPEPPGRGFTRERT